MGFYDELAKDVPWEIGSGTESYLKVINGKLQLPSTKWLQYHLEYLDKVIEAIDAFRSGVLVGVHYDLSKIIKHIIDTPEEAKRFLLDVLYNYNLFSIDIESQNLLTDANQNQVLCIGLAYKDNEGVCFTKNCFSEYFKTLFNMFCNNRNNTFILQNGIFDRSRTKILMGIDLKIDEDTMLMHYCGINEHKGTHGLKEMAALYLGFPDWEQELEDWKRNYCKTNKVKLSDFQYSYFPTKMLAGYNVIDCCATYQLYNVFKKLMRPETVTIYKKLVRASKYYADMITRGMLLNVEYWNKLKHDLETRIETLKIQLDKIIPGVLVTSPLQLLRCLKKRFPYDYIDSTDKYTMETLILKYPDDNLLNLIIEYRKMCKQLKTYVISLWNKKDYKDTIHCEFKLHGTETGRLSSSNPNMQNIPSDSSIKSLFISRHGYVFVQMDYSQAELRVLAYISEDESLIKCYVDGRDLHTEMQKQLFGDDFDINIKHQRMVAKTVNFGIPYGRTAAGMAQKLRISMSDAKQYLSNWFIGAPKVKQYIEKCHKMALAEPQQVYVTPFGRSRRYFITGNNINHTQNQSVNFPISSTANDLTIHSLVEIGDWLEQNKYDAYIVNTVHDSIILEVRPEDAETIAKKCQEIMASVPIKYLPNLSVPFRADVDMGTCWGDMKEPDWDGEEEE